MIRKPEDLPENAADIHFAEECCRYEQNDGERRFSVAMVESHVDGFVDLHTFFLRDDAHRSRLESDLMVAPQSNAFEECSAGDSLKPFFSGRVINNG